MTRHCTASRESVETITHNISIFRDCATMRPLNLPSGVPIQRLKRYGWSDADLVLVEDQKSG